MRVDGSGRVHLVESTPVLRPDEQVLQMMLDGFRRVPAHHIEIRTRPHDDRSYGAHD